MLDDEPSMLRASRILRVIGWMIIGIALVTIVFGLLHACRAISQPGLSEAEKARIEGASIAESLYNAFLILPGALVLGIGRWADRQQRRA